MRDNTDMNRSIPQRNALPSLGWIASRYKQVAGLGLYSIRSGIRSGGRPQTTAMHKSARFVVNLYCMITTGSETGKIGLIFR